jgi:phage I-like protein
VADAGDALSETHQELARYREEAIGRRVDDAVCAGKLPPALKSWGLALGRANPASFDEFIGKMAPIITHGTDPRFAGLPPGSAAGALSDPELAACRTLGITAESFARWRANAEGAGRWRKPPAGR